MKKRSFLAITLLTLAIAIGIGVFAWRADKGREARQTLQMEQLRAGDLAAARATLNEEHDWTALLREIEQAREPALVQAAFDVQFKHWYSSAEDTNFAYSEHPKVLAEQLKMGAVPRFEHLWQATSDDKSETAWLLLRAGVPAFESGATDRSPLANAAYWGDLNLVKELMRRGADLNQASAGGMTPLLAAAWSCRTDCVRFLLEHGADVSAPYEVWSGNTQPVWKVIEDRAQHGADFAAVWQLVRTHVPASAAPGP